MRLRSHSGRSAARDLDREAAPSVTTDRVGATLTESGDFSPEDLQRIAQYQERTGLSFADAAIDLGLMTPENISRAVTEQVQAGLIDPETSSVSPAVVAAFDPLDPLSLKLRALRSTLFAPDEMRGHDARVLMLAGVGTEDTPGVAANLAVLVAQLGFKGLLVDANFTAPTQHGLFGLENAEGVTSMLAGGGGQSAYAVPTPVPNLDLLAAGPEIAAISETVERVPLVAQLRAMRQGHRFVIIDAGDQAPEVLAALARGADGVLLVAERQRTSVEAMQTLLRRFESNDVPILGTILAR